MIMRIGYLAIFILCIFFQRAGAQLYEVSTGSISFHSNAPQELISAGSKNLRGVINAASRTYAFIIDISSFAGFNSPLQREHFNENYMESVSYPEAIFTGKIIEDVNLTNDGVYNVRAKGKLRIHGIEQERIINSVIVSKNGQLDIRSDFTVALGDHNIKIPRIVYEKLAPDINVSVKAVLVPKKQ